MTIINLSDYVKIREKNTPASITFFAPKFSLQDGTEIAYSVTVQVENGDVFGILEVVKDEGGVGQMQDGQYIFVPWPCACVVMHDLDEEPFGTSAHLGSE